MPAPGIRTIQAAVCREFDVHPITMSSDRKSQREALPRMVAMYLCRQFTKASTTAIGRAFGDRDHTTVLHACNVVKGRMEIDNVLAVRVDEIRRKLGEGEA